MTERKGYDTTRYLHVVLCSTSFLETEIMRLCWVGFDCNLIQSSRPRSWRSNFDCKSDTNLPMALIVMRWAVPTLNMAAHKFHHSNDAHRSFAPEVFIWTSTHVLFLSRLVDILCSLRFRLRVLSQCCGTTYMFRSATCSVVGFRNTRTKQPWQRIKMTPILCCILKAYRPHSSTRGTWMRRSIALRVSGPTTTKPPKNEVGKFDELNDISCTRWWPFPAIDQPYGLSLDVFHDLYEDFRSTMRRSWVLGAERWETCFCARSWKRKIDGTVILWTNCETKISILEQSQLWDFCDIKLATKRERWRDTLPDKILIPMHCFPFLAWTEMH